MPNWVPSPAREAYETPMWHAYFSGLAGGALIGAAAGLFMFTNGRVAGISGIAAELTGRWPRHWPQNLLFLAGLPLGLLLWRRFGLGETAIHLVESDLALVAAGLLVGFGARLGGGCTSGHGVCGLARLSPRSLAATAVFMAVAVLVVALRRMFA